MCNVLGDGGGSSYLKASGSTWRLRGRLLLRPQGVHDVHGSPESLALTQAIRADIHSAAAESNLLRTFLR